MTKRPTIRRNKSAYQREMEAYVLTALVTVAVMAAGFVAYAITAA